MRRGFNLVAPLDPAKHGALICPRSHKVDLLAKRLEADGIITSSRDNNLRDVDHLMDCLTKHKELSV